MKRIFILFRDSVKNVRHVVRILAAINKKDIYLVRTQCDNASIRDNKTVAQELQNDRQYVENTLKLKIPVLAISALQGPNFEDNAKFFALVKG